MQSARVLNIHGIYLSLDWMDGCVTEFGSTRRWQSRDRKSGKVAMLNQSNEQRADVRVRIVPRGLCDITMYRADEHRLMFSIWPGLSSPHRFPTHRSIHIIFHVSVDRATFNIYLFGRVRTNFRRSEHCKFPLAAGHIFHGYVKFIFAIKTSQVQSNIKFRRYRNFK